MPKAIDIELIILLPNDRFGLIASFHESPLMRSFSLPQSSCCLLCVIPRPPYLREAFGMRSGCAPSPAPCAMHIHPPHDFPLTALITPYLHTHSPIFCPHSFKIAFNPKKVPEKFCQYDKSAYLCTRFPKGKPKRQANGSLTDCEQQTRQGSAEM